MDSARAAQKKAHWSDHSSTLQFPVQQTFAIKKTWLKIFDLFGFDFGR